MGKAPGMDEKRQKATYPAVLGLEATREWARRLVEEAIAGAGILSGTGRTLAGAGPLSPGAARLTGASRPGNGISV